MTTKKEMPIEKQIKNLQVSISIAKREIADILKMLPTLAGNEKQEKVKRIVVCEQIISTKEKQLIPLKAEWQKIKPSRSTNYTVTNDDVNEVMKKYGIK